MDLKNIVLKETEKAYYQLMNRQWYGQEDNMVNFIPLKIVKTLTYESFGDLIDGFVSNDLSLRISYYSRDEEDRGYTSVKLFSKSEDEEVWIRKPLEPKVREKIISSAEQDAIGRNSIGVDFADLKNLKEKNIKDDDLWGYTRLRATNTGSGIIIFDVKFLGNEAHWFDWDGDIPNLRDNRKYHSLIRDNISNKPDNYWNR